MKGLGSSLAMELHRLPDRRQAVGDDRRVTVDLPIDNDDHVFTMRQVSLTVPGTKTSRDNDGHDATRQIHILTTRVLKEDQIDMNAWLEGAFGTPEAPRLQYQRTPKYWGP